MSKMTVVANTLPRVCCLPFLYIPEQYPSLFTGLRTLKGEEYKIQLQPGAKPFALNTPRNVALAQREQVRAELDRIESLGVISKALSQG